ncbi:NUDIX domain-containing protein [Candidatus Woesearchaeota archaeon]|nr:NUDIX domain-containing protein [Candidatus Woesearchaeota archaeon]
MLQSLGYKKTKHLDGGILAWQEKKKPVFSDFLSEASLSETIPYTPEDLLDHHGIAAVITNEKGEILMQDHVKYKFWTLPVGKVHPSQTVEEGLAQELFEECNIVIEKWKEIATREYDYIRNGKNVAVSAHVFVILQYSGDIKNKEPHKHKEQLFLSLDKIKELPCVSDITLLYLESIGIKRKKKLSSPKDI